MYHGLEVVGGPIIACEVFSRKKIGISTLARE